MASLTRRQVGRPALDAPRDTVVLRAPDGAGIITGMKSYQNAETVRDDLGEKFLAALALAVAATRRDLDEYRANFPHFVADSSKRGLANWIHDRLWQNLFTLLHDVSDVFFIDKGATREICVGVNYRIRLKRHHAQAGVSTYPTPTALEFLSQPPEVPTLPGLEDVHLIAGYRWLDDCHEVGPAVISLRDGKDNVLWIVEVPETGSTDSLVPLPERPMPFPPIVGGHRSAASTENAAAIKK